MPTSGLLNIIATPHLGVASPYVAAYTSALPVPPALPEVEDAKEAVQLVLDYLDEVVRSRWLSGCRGTACASEAGPAFAVRLLPEADQL